jgi:hypothetical protein
VSSETLPPIESVAGGSHGIEAGYDQMLALADRYEQQAGDFVAMAGLGVRVMADGDLLESAILSPLSFADAQAQVLDATTGADGLTVRAVGIEADALAVRAVVAAFGAGDALSRHATEMIDHALGRLAVSALPALLVAGGVGYAWFSTLSAEEQAALTEQVGEDLGALLHDHPELAQHLVNAGGGLLGSLVPGVGVLDPGDGPIGQATTNDAARLMALLLGNDTDCSVTGRPDVAGGAGPHTPGNLEQLMRQLSATNDLDASEADLNGAIQVQRVGQEPDERYIVYVPGTDDMGPIPQAGDRARDMETNYQLLGGWTAPTAAASSRQWSRPASPART